MNQPKKCIQIHPRVALAMRKSLTKGQHYISLLKLSEAADELVKNTKWYSPFFNKISVGDLRTWKFPLVDKAVAFSIRYDGVLDGNYVIKVYDVVFLDTPNKEDVLKKKALKKTLNRFVIFTSAALAALAAMIQSLGSIGEAISGIVDLLTMVLVDK